MNVLRLRQGLSSISCLLRPVELRLTNVSVRPHATSSIEDTANGLIRLGSEPHIRTDVAK